MGAEEEKEAEIQIGFPTDVKHVAHIGWDGPAAQDNPSWMKDFKGQSAPLDATTGLGSGDPNTNTEAPDIKWASEGGLTASESSAPHLPKRTRRKKSKESDAIGTPSSCRKSSRAAPSHPAAAAATSAPDGEADNGDHCEEAPAKEDYGGK
nr:CRIB domain-containing protein RIC6-like [Ipomoea batatas]